MSPKERFRSQSDRPRWHIPHLAGEKKCGREGAHRQLECKDRQECDQSPLSLHGKPANFLVRASPADDEKKSEISNRCDVKCVGVWFGREKRVNEAKNFHNRTAGNNSHHKARMHGYIQLHNSVLERAIEKNTMQKPILDRVDDKNSIGRHSSFILKQSTPDVPNCEFYLLFCGLFLFFILHQFQLIFYFDGATRSSLFFLLLLFSENFLWQKVNCP